MCGKCGHPRHRHRLGTHDCKEDGCKCQLFEDPEAKYRKKMGLAPGLGRGAGGPAVKKPKKKPSGYSLGD